MEYGLTDVRRSFSAHDRRITSPSGTGRPMRYGDKIFVRLRPAQFGIGEGMEFTTFEANDMSEVLGELRHRMRRGRGLWHMYIRNVTRGWSVDRPIMLYGTGVARQPAAATAPATRKSAVPESVRLRFLA